MTGVVVRRKASSPGSRFPAATFDIAGADCTVLILYVPEGRSMFAWPENELPKAGTDETFRVGSKDGTATITLSAIVIDKADPLELAQLLIKRRCNFALGMFADKADQLDADD